MFMFRKKEKTISVITGLQKEAYKFQDAVAEINKDINPQELTIEVLMSYATKYNMSINPISSTFKSFLKKNAIKEIKKIKLTPNYTILDLEQAAEKFGFTTDDLAITYYSED